MPRYVFSGSGLTDEKRLLVDRMINEHPDGPWVLWPDVQLQDLDSPWTPVMPTAELQESGDARALHDVALIAGGAIAGIVATLLVVSQSVVR